MFHKNLWKLTILIVIMRATVNFSNYGVLTMFPDYIKQIEATTIPIDTGSTTNTIQCFIAPSSIVNITTTTSEHLHGYKTPTIKSLKSASNSSSSYLSINDSTIIMSSLVLSDTAENQETLLCCDPDKTPSIIVVIFSTQVVQQQTNSRWSVDSQYSVSPKQKKKASATSKTSSSKCDYFDLLMDLSCGDTNSSVCTEFEIETGSSSTVDTNDNSSCSSGGSSVYNMKEICMEALIGSIPALPIVIIAGLLIDKYGRIPVNICAMAVAAASMFFYWFFTSDIEIVLTYCIFRAAITIPNVGKEIITVEQFPTSIRSTALGVTAVLGRIAGILAVLLYANFISVNRAIPVLVTLVLLLSGMFAISKLPESKEQQI